MDKDITIDFIENNLNIVQKLYDFIRVVDPITKRVLLYNGNTLVEKGSSCFNKIGKEGICENCISIRALKDKKTYMKIENVDNKSYLITVLPIEFDNKTLIVELIKEATDSLFYGHSLDGQGCKVSNIINDLKLMTIRDSLTDIGNRRFIDETLPIDMNLCFKKDEPISIIMVDVDYFKSINDKFGHITGDFVLKELAGCLKQCIRNKKDWIGRYGGEEFLVCIPGADEKAALEIAERMHERIAEKKFIHNNEHIKITASFGICSTSNKEITVEEFLSFADKKLYEAKNAGRNRIVF
jgi:diguanylate cyclase (GGDEF)-like protein